MISLELHYTLLTNSLDRGMAEKERRGARARLALAELLLDLFALGLTLIPVALHSVN